MSGTFNISTLLAGSYIGNPGATGATGYTGSTGPQGASGIGASGVQGEFGSTGPQGIQGASGSTGPQGIQGASGATGIQGASGATGVGINGASGPVAGARVGATGGAISSITPDASLYDNYMVNNLGASGTINAPSGTPTDGQRLVIRIEDNGVARGLLFAGATGAYRAIGTTLPTVTTASKVIYVGCQYNSLDSFWDVIAVVVQA